MVLNLMIGLVTPPVRTVLYTLQRITGVPLERLSYAMLPWYVPPVVPPHGPIDPCAEARRMTTSRPPPCGGTSLVCLLMAGQPNDAA